MPVWMSEVSIGGTSTRFRFIVPSPAQKCIYASFKDPA
jgi:hypothetical protein